MKVINVGIGIILVCLSSLGFSQPINEAAILAEIELARAVASKDVKTIIGNNMRLNEAEAAGFWGVYESYQSDMQTVNDRLLDLITEYAAYYNSEGDTGVLASSLTNEYFDIEKDRIGIKKKYLRKFKKVVSDEKVTLFYQIDNRLNTLVNLGMMQQVPLIIE